LRVCSRCNEAKDPAEFYENVRHKDGRKRVCKDCHRDWHLRTSYGITPEIYKKLQSLNDGGCHICSNKNTNGKRLSVDHDHDTGLVRGLLCEDCNLGIGRFKDDEKRLAEAIFYLRGHAQTLHHQLKMKEKSSGVEK
jgi:hypothetical protein